MSKNNEKNYVNIVYDEEDLTYDPIKWLASFTSNTENSNTATTVLERNTFYKEQNKTLNISTGSRNVENFVNLEDLMNEAIIQSTAQDLSLKKY